MGGVNVVAVEMPSKGVGTGARSSASGVWPSGKLSKGPGGPTLGRAAAVNSVCGAGGAMCGTGTGAKCMA